MPQTKLKPLIRYSPRPLSEYAKTLGALTVGPYDSPMLRTTAAWNLAYLSYDYEKSMQHHDPQFTVHVRRTAQTRLDGSGVDLADQDDPTTTVAGWLALPAPRFVHLVANHPILHSLPLFKAYGQDWLSTITARSYLCQTDENPPDNVVDFALAKALLSKF